MKEDNFIKFDQNCLTLEFFRANFIRFGEKELTRRIYEILQWIGVRADLKTQEIKQKYSPLFRKGIKERVIGTRFYIEFPPDTEAYKKQLVYAAMVGFNYGYWQTGI